MQVTYKQYIEALHFQQIYGAWITFITMEKQKIANNYYMHFLYHNICPVTHNTQTQADEI